MHALSLTPSAGRRALHVLCLGAHCDDIEIGCGGTLLSLLARNPNLGVTWVVFASNPARERELRASAKRFLRGARSQIVIAHQFRDGFFPANYGAIKEAFESLKGLRPPDVIFTHHWADLHQDHRTVAELTRNTFRNHLVFGYEIPKYEGGLTTPSAYFALTERQVERKTQILLECYGTQRGRHWFTADTFRALPRLRGIESGAASGWAEGFHADKFLVS